MIIFILSLIPPTGAFVVTFLAATSATKTRKCALKINKLAFFRLLSQFIDLLADTRTARSLSLSKQKKSFVLGQWGCALVDT